MSTPARAHRIGSFFLGSNYALTDTKLAHNFTTHEVDRGGITFGFMFPIVRQQFGLAYKGTVAFHGVTDIYYGSTPRPSDDIYYRNLDQYIASLNGLVVSRRFDTGDRWYVEPMIGVGVLVHIIYGNKGEGIAYGSFQTDISSLVMYEFDAIDVGGFFSINYVPFGGYGDPWDLAYLTFGVAVAR